MTKNEGTIIAVGLLFAAILSPGGMAHSADTGQKDTYLQSPTPGRSSNDSGNTSIKDRSEALLPAPVLASDAPEIGLAAFKGDVGTLRRLISSGANIESTGKDKRTPLFLASAGGHMEAVSVLLAAGANINARDSGGSTALHWAAQRGDEKIALLLLSHRPDVNVQDEFGETPLIWAAMVGDKPIVEALLTAGANPNFVDVSGLTASAWAKKNKHLDIASLLHQNR